MSSYSFVITLIIVVAWEAHGKPHTLPSPATQLNSTSTVHNDEPLHNITDKTTFGSRISTILRDLPTLKNIVIFICVLSTLLITCLVIKVYRTGKKIRKTRKYDIITTPAERVEMAPLNEENEDDDDSTLFDVKYR
ncbi:membrane protein FAM174B [Chanos chanos]|uniref:Membrane protein FAM174B n=1 Tax=Chanos chanos TaxID=29144 RepID=A0A6J2UNJ9_CHACN|nr:membrane protein FAM174B-like [Chanos chanos]